jgi:lysozyme family protein
MSYFEDAYAKTMGHEGGYCNDPDDAGGETYKGIARNFHGSWMGWTLIDEYKGDPRFPKCLDQDTVLQDMVKAFYKATFFDVFRGDDMPLDLALEMFDTGVNMGVGRAIGFLQTALNVLNRNGQLYPDIVEDGAYGNNTHKTLHTYLNTDSSGLLVKIINVLQGMHYINYMKKSPTQEKYARGWFNRVEISK